MHCIISYNYLFPIGFFSRVCPDLEEMLDPKVPLASLEMLDRKVVKVIRDLRDPLVLLALKDLKAAWA